MNHLKIHPAPELKSFITGYYFIEDQGMFANKTLTGIPLGHHELYIFNQPIQTQVSNRENSFSAEGSSFLSGYFEGPSIIVTKEPVRGVVIDFTPIGLKNILGVPATEFTSKVIDGYDFLGKELGILIEEIQEQSSYNVIANVLNKFFIAKKQKTDSSKKFNLVFNTMVSSLYNGKITPSISNLQSKSGFSKRYFEKQFKEHTGVSAKTITRLIRANNAINHILQEQNLFDIIYHLNYCDQSHLIKEVKWLTGYTPVKVLSQRNNSITIGTSTFFLS